MLLLKSKVKQRRPFSEAFVKQTVALFGPKTADPVKELLFNPERVDRICQRNRFLALSEREKETLLTIDLLRSLGPHKHLAKRLQCTTVVPRVSSQSFVVRHPLLTEVDSTQARNSDYALPLDGPGFDTLRSIASPLSPDSPRDDPQALLTEFEVFVAVQRAQQSFEDSLRPFALTPHQLLCDNFSADFDLFAFKQFVKARAGSRVDWEVQRDCCGSPSAVRLTFPSTEAAGAFKGGAQGMAFNGRLVRVLDHSHGEAESFANRTVVVQGLPEGMTENAVLAMAQCYGHVEQVVVPLGCQGSATPFTSDVMDFIGRHKGEWGRELRVVLSEVGPEGVRRFVAFDGAADSEGRAAEGQSGSEAPDVEALARSAQEKRQSQTRQGLEHSRVVELSTLSDALRPAHQRADHAQSHRSSEGSPLVARPLPALQLRSLVWARLHSAFPERTATVSPSNFPSQLGASSMGTCFVTFTSAWEAKRGLYGIRYLSHLKRSDVGLLGPSLWADHVGALTDRLYQLIEAGAVARQQARDSVLQGSAPPDPLSKHVSLSDLNTEVLGRTQSTVPASLDLLARGETEVRAQWDLRERLREEAGQCLADFVETREFSAKPHLESRLSDLSEVEGVLERRGRRFEPTPFEERVRILEGQLERSRGRWRREAATRAGVVEGVLDRAVRGAGREEAGWVAGRLAQEYGLRDEEVLDLQEALRAQQQRLGQKRYFLHEEPSGEPRWSTTHLKRAADTRPVDPFFKASDPSRPVKSFKKRSRLDLFNSVGSAVARRHFASAPSDEQGRARLAEQFRSLCDRLQARLSGEHFESDWFADCVVRNFQLKRAE